MAVQETNLQNDLAMKLNVQVANWAVLYFKLHHFHWFVKGDNFETLHAKFEELYNFASASLDEFAERLLAIGISPISSMKEFLASASIQENANAGVSATEMLDIVIADFSQMARELLETAELAESKANDIVTADLLREQVKELQKQVWMLKASAGK